MQRTEKCLIVMDKWNITKFVFLSNEARDCGLHNAGISPEKYKELGYKSVIGNIVFEADEVPVPTAEEIEAVQRQLASTPNDPNLFIVTCGHFYIDPYQSGAEL